MKKGMTLGLATVAGLFLAGGAAADHVLLFDIDADQGAWDAYLAGANKQEKSSYDLSALLGDPGVVGMDGPFAVTDNVSVDSNLNPFGTGGPAGRGAGGSGLVVVGPSAGFGNSETSLLANFFVDSFDILMGDRTKTAASFDATSLLGSNTVDITVYTTGGSVVTFSGLDAGAAGHTYGIGIAAGDGDTIDRINIYDAGGGAEGLTGSGSFYVAIPAPGALALLGVAGLVGRRRRNG